MNDEKEATKKDDGGVKEQRKTVPLKDVIADLKNVGVQYFVNTKHEPVVFLPDTPFQQYWLAGHDRVAAYLSAAYHDLSKGGFIKSAELASLLALLKEECYKGGRRLTELESPEAEKEPIIQAVICFMNSNESFEGMTAVLLSKLNERDIMRTVRGIEDFPILTNIFSRRLNRLTPTLRGLGVEVSIWHEEDGSHCKLKRLPNFIKETDALTRQSSASPSIDTLSSVLHLAFEHAFSQFPVVDDGRFNRVVTENEITRWLGHQVSNGTTAINLADVTIRTVLREREPDERVIFRIERLDASEEEVMGLFQRQPALEVVLLTESGGKNKLIEGIVTQWDAARYPDGE